MDSRGIPSAVCPECGSDVLRIYASFDDSYEISMYLLEAECAFCESPMTAPTPLDLPKAV